MHRPLDVSNESADRQRAFVSAECNCKFRTLDDAFECPIAQVRKPHALQGFGHQCYPGARSDQTTDGCELGRSMLDLGLKARVAPYRFGMSIEAHTRMQAGYDEQLFRQVSDMQSLAAGQRVGLMDREQDAFAADGLDDDTWRPLQHWRADKPDIQLVLIEEPQLFPGRYLIQADVDLWALAKLAQLHGRFSCGLDNTRLLKSPDTLLAIRMSA